jgi:hypothetical protein
MVAATRMIAAPVIISMATTVPSWTAVATGAPRAAHLVITARPASGTAPAGARKCADWRRPKARDQNPRNGFRLHMNSSITARHVPATQAALSLIHIGQNWWRKYGSERTTKNRRTPFTSH